MDFKWVGVVLTIFIGLTLITNVMSGSGFITQSDRDILDNQKMTTEVDLGIVSIPIPGSGYVNGLIRMLDFKEYNDILFTGNAQIIYFALTGISFMVLLFLFITLIGAMVNKFRPG